MIIIYIAKFLENSKFKLFLKASDKIIRLYVNQENVLKRIISDVYKFILFKVFIEISY